MKTSLFIIYLVILVSSPLWIDCTCNRTLEVASGTDGPRCPIYQYDEERTAKIYCYKEDNYFCYYPHGTPCSNDTQRFLIIKASTSTAASPSESTPNTPENKYHIILIIALYLTSVVLIIAGGIAVVKIKQCKENKNGDSYDDDYYYFPPAKYRPRAPFFQGMNRPNSLIARCQAARVRNLSDVQEVSENATSPPGSASRVGDDQSDPHAGVCPPTPGLYTPLLNPGDDTSTLFFGRISRLGADANLQELIENPVYEGYTATTRL